MDSNTNPNARTRYDLRDVDGTVVATHIRVPATPLRKKRFIWDVPGLPFDTTLHGIPAPTLPLYGTERLRGWPDDAPIIITEGEKAAIALHERGLYALGTATGAGDQPIPSERVLSVLAGRAVIVWPDRDDVGHEHMEKVAARLTEIGATVRWFDWPDAPDSGDAANWTGTTEELEAALASAPAWTPRAKKRANGRPLPSARSRYPSSSSDTETDDDDDDDEAPPLPPAPPFPVEHLPGPVANVVGLGAAALGGPPDFVAVPLLALVGALIGRKFHLYLKKSYTVWAILYAAVVGVTGSGKSPGLALACKPVDALQDAAVEQWKADTEQYQADLAAWEKEKPADRGAKPPTPTLTHFYTTDATMEALAMMLQSSAGVTLIRDELSGWVKSMDMYRGGKGGDRQRWLSGWSKAPLKIDRKSSATIYVPDPVVNVIGGIQPDVLPELAHEAKARDGFLERILWSWPDDAMPDWTEDDVSDDAIKNVATIFAALAKKPSNPDAKSVAIHLAPDAKAAWIVWRNRTMREARAMPPGTMQGIVVKLEQQSLRLALILHCLSHSDNPSALPIDIATIESAIAVTDYFRAHAARVMPFFDRDDAAPDRTRQKEDDAWLRQFLAAGPLFRDDVFDAAFAAGISRPRTYAAQKRLKITSAKHGKHGHYQWTLPPSQRSQLSQLSQLTNTENGQNPPSPQQLSQVSQLSNPNTLTDTNDTAQPLP